MELSFPEDNQCWPIQNKSHQHITIKKKTILQSRSLSWKEADGAYRQ